MDLESTQSWETRPCTVLESLDHVASYASQLQQNRMQTTDALKKEMRLLEHNLCVADGIAMYLSRPSLGHGLREAAAVGFLFAGLKKIEDIRPEQIGVELHYVPSDNFASLRERMFSLAELHELVRRNEGSYLLELCKPSGGIPLSVSARPFLHVDGPLASLYTYGGVREQALQRIYAQSSFVDLVKGYLCLLEPEPAELSGKLC